MEDGSGIKDISGVHVLPLPLGGGFIFLNPNKKQPPAQYVREPRAPGIRPSGRLLYLEVAAGRAGCFDGVAVLDRVTHGRSGHNGKDA